jgi:hypothetical protein
MQYKTNQSKAGSIQFQYLKERNLKDEGVKKEQN